MPSIIELQNIRSQRITVRLDGLQHELRIYSTNDGMSFDLIRENEIVLQGQRVVLGTPLIPYQYISQGNFIIISNGEQIPDFRLFGESQELIYFSAEELTNV